MADSQHHDEVGNTKESNLGGDEDDIPRNPHRKKPSNVVTVEAQENDDLGLDIRSDETQERRLQGHGCRDFDDQFEMQNDEQSPRMPIFVAGRSPRYVNQSPRKGDPGTLIYESSTSPNVSPRVKLTGGSFGAAMGAATATSGASQSQNANITIGSPGKNVLMSPLRFGHSPMSMSPPGASMISLEELKQVAETAANYKLVHEISTEPDFKLSPRTVDPNSLEGRIKEVMERAFWDVLRDDLEQDPPNYDHALNLLQEIRQVVLDHLLKPENCKQIVQKFKETIDIDLIKQQIEQGSFDIYQYSNYIIDTLSKVCAPCRDERMAEMRKIKDVVLLFRELMKTLDLMKLDMANFLIAQSRPLFQQHSIEYERAQFDKFLATQKDQGLQYTREWLFRAKERLTTQLVPTNSPTGPVQVVSPGEAASSSGSGTTSEGGRMPTGREILNEAFMELLDWKEPIEKYPETCVLDVTRFVELSFEYRYLVLTASLLLVSLNVIGANATQMSSFVENIKAILKDILDQSPGLKRPEDLLESFVTQIIKQLQMEGRLRNDETSVKPLQATLNALSDDQHSVKNLLAKRAQRYLKIGLDSATHSNPASVPPAFIPIQKELMAFTAKFLKIASYNREVFRPHYTNMIEDFTITID